MKNSKLGIDFKKVEEAKMIAASIANEVQQFVNRYTTVAVERTLCRLIGIDDVDAHEVPLPNVVVEQLHQNGLLGQGALYFLGNAMLETKLNPQQIAEKMAQQELNITKLTIHSDEKIRSTIAPLIEATSLRISKNVAERKRFLEILGEGKKPYIYVIVATGNIFEDVIQAQAAARQGADIIAVIRSTGQSLLDYVPFGATVEGFGGTFATQENFKIMRKALDEVGEEVGRYIRLCNYCSGLCMPEIAAMGALERLDVMLNDALYGILFRDINPQRTLVDQYFSRMINGFAGVIINTGEDNYLTTADAFEEAHTVLASDLINEQLALLAGIPEEQMGLGHAFEMDPDLENGFLYELAQAQLTREIFPKAPLKYMPPTKFKTGNIFKGHLQDALFNIIGIWTKQGIQLLGMPTEAIHTPFMSDRFLSIENAKYIFNNMASLNDEVEFKENGIIRQRAQFVLDEAIKLLKVIEKEGLFTTLEKGNFGNVKRPKTGGKGLQGVAEKGTHYFNPFVEKWNFTALRAKSLLD
jgi:beta-lysine 5,6-aminomutase alpha subunit